MYYITGTRSAGNLDGLNTFLWNKGGLFQPGLLFDCLLAEGPPCPQSCLTHGRAEPWPDPRPALSRSNRGAKRAAVGDPWGLGVPSQGTEVSFCKAGRLQPQRGTEGSTPRVVGIASGAPSSFSTLFSSGATASWIRVAQLFWLLKPWGTLVTSCKCTGGRHPPTCANRQSLLQRKGKSTYDKKQAEGQSNNTTAKELMCGRQGRVKSRDFSQKSKYLLLAISVAPKNRGNRTAGRNLLT